MQATTAEQTRIAPKEEALLAAVVAHGASSPTPPPSAPSVLLDRSDLARLFKKNKQEPKRWERKKWICAARRPSGRILGYDVVQVASLAARFAGHFRGPVFSTHEAEQQGLTAILTWVVDSVRAQPSDERRSASIHVLFLAALADAPEVLPAALEVTPEQLKEYRDEAKRLLRERLDDPTACRQLVAGWVAAGIAKQTTKASTVKAF